jgi:hypothetical protein
MARQFKPARFFVMVEAAVFAVYGIGENPADV